MSRWPGGLHFCIPPGHAICCISCRCSTRRAIRRRCCAQARSTLPNPGLSPDAWLAPAAFCLCAGTALMMSCRKIRHWNRGGLSFLTRQQHCGRDRLHSSFRRQYSRHNHHGHHARWPGDAWYCAQTATRAGELRLVLGHCCDRALVLAALREDYCSYVPA